MFENKTTADIHKEMIDDTSDKYDKTDGAFIFDATRPAAIKFEESYADMNIVAGLIDVENLEKNELTKFVNQRTGQERHLATYAIGFVEVEGNGIVKEGDLFQTPTGVRFESLENKTIKEIGIIKIRAVEPGKESNVPSSQITEMPISLSGMNTVSNPEPTTEGYEEETDDQLRQRYYERIQTPATSGNKWHYRNWAKEVPGVGEVRIKSLWNGDNTVKVIVIDSNMQPASNLLIDAIQKHIDPGGTGLGDGEAPIGAFLTVVSATERKIDISFNVVIEQGYDQQHIITNVTEKLNDYLERIAFKQNFVSYAQIGSMILDSEGVVDYSVMTVNGVKDNIILTDEEVVTLGGVTIVQ